MPNRLKLKRPLAAFAMALAAVFSLSSPDSALAGDPGVTDDEIRLGALGVLTGPYAIFGASVFDGVQIVYNQVNEAGGIHGRKINYIRADDRCSPTDAVGAVKKLIHEDQVFAIHGGACSNASVAAKPEIVDAGVPWVITASTLDSLTDPVNPLIFSTMTASWMDTYGQLQYAVDQGAKRIAIVAQKDAWGQERREILNRALGAQEGIEIVADETLPPEPTDATAVALRVQASNPDAVLVILYPRAGSIYLRDAAKIGYKPLVVGPPPLSDLGRMGDMVGVPGAIENLVAVAPVGYMPNDPSLEEWRATFARYYPGDTFAIYQMLGIASAQFVVAALEKAGPDLTREGFLAAMEGLTVEVDTLGGPLSCTAASHQCHRTPTVFGFRDGKPAALGHVDLSGS